MLCLDEPGCYDWGSSVSTALADFIVHLIVTDGASKALTPDIGLKKSSL